MKRDGRSLEHKTLAELRRMAIQRVVEDGVKPSEIASEYGFCRNYLYPWLQKFRDGGWEALAERIAEGPTPKLTERQRQQVKRWILGKDPRQYGFDFGLWSRRIVQALIQERMGVAVGLTAVGRLLAGLDITPQKPLRRAYERDPKAVKLWLEETYPQLKRRARRLGAKIFFLDEAGFQSGTDLWVERQNAGGRDFGPTPEPQCDQCGQCARGILGGHLHRQVERGRVCGVLGEFHEAAPGKGVAGGR